LDSDFPLGPREITTRLVVSLATRGRPAELKDTIATVCIHVHRPHDVPWVKA
jgi:hypothetical protein